MATYVLSLGGSLIVPDKVDIGYLKKFVALIKHLSKKHRLVIVTGGGSIARLYIDALHKAGAPQEMQSWAGIKCCGLNAVLLNSLFGNLEPLPDSLQEVKFMLASRKIIVCAALGFQPDMTSDGTAAEVAAYVGADAFVNLTNVSGLFSRDPHKFKSAKLIPFISFAAFLRHAREIAYTPGQHFVLDQQAARIILRERIRTFILDGHDVKNLELCLLGKSFVGTVIHE